jgi:hypothetical protein
LKEVPIFHGFFIMVVNMEIIYRVAVVESKSTLVGVGLGMMVTLVFPMMSQSPNPHKHKQ